MATGTGTRRPDPGSDPAASAGRGDRPLGEDDDQDDAEVGVVEYPDDWEGTADESGTAADEGAGDAAPTEE